MSDDDSRSNSADAPQARTLAVEVVRRSSAWDHCGLNDATIQLAAHAAFAEALPPAPAAYEISILLTDDTEMRELNHTWRSKDQPTNVLSFPAADTLGDIGVPGDLGVLGDIAIAYETAQREADALGRPFVDYVSQLVVHGIIHLLGFDHETDRDAEQMERLEGKALAALGLANPYEGGSQDAFAEAAK